MNAERRAELARGLAAVRERIEGACEESGRRSEEITLVVVTKYFPASDVRLLVDLGIRDFGENRHQEAVLKAEECADLDPVWHFIGALQSNKAAAVAGYADVVQSVDRAKVINALDRGAQDRGAVLDCLVQVSLDPPGAEGRSGSEVDALPALAEHLVRAQHLRLRGVMGVAPLGGEARRAFALLGDAAAVVRQVAPEARWISAGMSGDLEDAVREGATHLRIGSAVLGPRPAVK